MSVQKVISFLIFLKRSAVSSLISRCTVWTHFVYVTVAGLIQSRGGGHKVYVVKISDKEGALDIEMKTFL